MPLSTSALLKPYLATTGHNSGGASSTLGQPNWTAVSQMRSISHCHSVAFRHQYASDCLMRPFVTTRLLLQIRETVSSALVLLCELRAFARNFVRYPTATPWHSDTSTPATV